MKYLAKVAFFSGKHIKKKKKTKENFVASALNMDN